MLNDELIVDVGASNVAAFMAEMTRFKSAIGEFDLILVPTVPADKQQRDTIATVDWLCKLGVQGARIRVLFNQYAAEDLEPIEVAYAQLTGYAMTDGKGKAGRKTVLELAGDSTDWKELRREAKRSGGCAAAPGSGGRARWHPEERSRRSARGVGAANRPRPAQRQHPTCAAGSQQETEQRRGSP